MSRFVSAFDASGHWVLRPARDGATRRLGAVINDGSTRRASTDASQLARVNASRDPRGNASPQAARRHGGARDTVNLRRPAVARAATERDEWAGAQREWDELAATERVAA